MSITIEFKDGNGSYDRETLRLLFGTLRNLFEDTNSTEIILPYNKSEFENLLAYARSKIFGINNELFDFLDCKVCKCSEKEIWKNVLSVDELDLDIIKTVHKSSGTLPDDIKSIAINKKNFDVYWYADENGFKDDFYPTVDVSFRFLRTGNDKNIAKGFELFTKITKYYIIEDLHWNAVNVLPDQVKFMISQYIVDYDMSYSGSYWNNLGLMYHNGYGTTQSYTKAEEVYKKTILRFGHEGPGFRSMYNLALIYKHTHKDDMEKYIKEILRLFKLASEHNVWKSSCALGQMYYKGKYVTKNDDTAMMHFDRAIRDIGKNDKIRSKFIPSIAQIYIKEGRINDVIKLGKIIPRNTLAKKILASELIGSDNINGINKAIRLYTDHDEVKKDMYLTYHIGKLYRSGTNVEQDLPKAFEMLKQVADAGYSSAMIRIAIMYKNGEGVNQNDKKAFKLFKKAFEKGKPKASYYLAVMYENGEGVKQDLDEALSQYKHAASIGNSDASLKIATMIHKDNKEDALRLCQDEIKKGNKQALCTIAKIYDEHGDHKKSVLFFEKWINQKK